MMRESGSVRLTVRGPGVRGAGGAPRASDRCARFALRAPSPWFRSQPAHRQNAGGARLDLGLRLADGLQPRPTPRQLLREVQPFGQGLGIGRLGAGQKLRHLHLQLGLDLLGMPIRQALWREALAWRLVPSKATVPSSKSFILYLPKALHPCNPGSSPSRCKASVRTGPRSP